MTTLLEMEGRHAAEENNILMCEQYIHIHLRLENPPTALQDFASRPIEADRWS